MPLPLLATLAIGIGFQVLGFLLMPKPKAPKPEAAKDLENPTAEAGRPIPVVFGSLTMTSPNNIGFWDKETRSRKAGGSGGKK